MTRATPLKDLPVPQAILNAAIETAAAWRGIARQYYDEHQAVAELDLRPCPCGKCGAYRERITKEHA